MGDRDREIEGEGKREVLFIASSASDHNLLGCKYRTWTWNTVALLYFPSCTAD